MKRNSITCLESTQMSSQEFSPISSTPISPTMSRILSPTANTRNRVFFSPQRIF